MKCCLVILALALSALGSGCASSPMLRPHTVRAELDPALIGSRVTVDLIGVSDLELFHWRGYSVSQYWQPGNPVRRDAKKFTFQFVPGIAATLQLPEQDPIWADWFRTGAIYLVILADLPGIAADLSGNPDPRRLIFPLQDGPWEGMIINILVHETGLQLLAPSRP